MADNSFHMWSKYGIKNTGSFHSKVPNRQIAFFCTQNPLFEKVRKAVEKREKRRKTCVFFIYSLGSFVWVDVYVRYLVFGWVGAYTKIFKGKCLAIIQHRLCVGLHGIAVEYLFTDVYTLCRQCNIVAVGCGAHGEQKATAHHKVSYRLCNGNF